MAVACIVLSLFFWCRQAAALVSAPGRFGLWLGACIVGGAALLPLCVQGCVGLPLGGQAEAILRAGRSGAAQCKVAEESFSSLSNRVHGRVCCRASRACKGGGRVLCAALPLLGSVRFSHTVCWVHLQACGAFPSLLSSFVCRLTSRPCVLVYCPS